MAKRCSTPFGPAREGTDNTWEVKIVRRMSDEDRNAHGTAFYESQRVVAELDPDPFVTLDNLFHEWIHAEYELLSEEAVERGARHFTMACKKLGIVNPKPLRRT